MPVTIYPVHGRGINIFYCDRIADVMISLEFVIYESRKNAR